MSEPLFSFANPVIHERGLFNPDGEIDAANEEMARKVGAALTKHFDKVPWAVMAEIEHGIVKVAVAGFLQWPYVIHVSTIKSDPGMKSVLEAGGHLLERFGIRRSQFSFDDWNVANRRFPAHFHRTKKAPE